MKHQRISLLSISILLIFSFQCQSDDPIYLKSCNIPGDTQTIIEKEGTLLFTDTIPGFKFVSDIYIIFYDDSLPLTICNVPDEGYDFVKSQDSVHVKFSGIREILPETVDAITEKVEIHTMEKIQE